MEEVTIAQTPDISFQAAPALRLMLRDFVNNNEIDILDGTHTVELQLPPMTPFRAGAFQPGSGFPWNPGGITNLEARHKFALATCNGCHTSETGTMFLHIAPRKSGSEAKLSDFLTGLNQPTNDPVNPDPAAKHTFHDLLDRQMKLDATANMNCQIPIDDLFEERFLPPGFVH